MPRTWHPSHGQDHFPSLSPAKPLPDGGGGGGGGALIKMGSSLMSLELAALLSPTPKAPGMSLQLGALLSPAPKEPIRPPPLSRRLGSRVEETGAAHSRWVFKKVGRGVKLCLPASERVAFHTCNPSFTLVSVSPPSSVAVPSSQAAQPQATHAPKPQV